MFRKKFFAMIFFGAMFIFVAEIFGNVANASPEISNRDENSSEIQWYWLRSNDKYSKYFDPDSVKIIKSAKVGGKDVATEIEAWTKTSYSYEGATETIRNYEISSSIPDPKSLAYSLVLFKVNPQTRTIQRLREDFYNPNNKKIYSEKEGRIKEVNSRSFEEDFYAAIVDEVFMQGEVERKNAQDRWMELWSYTNDEGTTTTVTADTTTMQLKGTNLIVWEWQDVKNSSKQTTEIRFIKKSVNLAQGTEKISSGEVWTAGTKSWHELDDENEGSYRMIKNSEPDYKGLIRLRTYVKANPTWVKRYSIA